MKQPVRDSLMLWIKLYSLIETKPCWALHNQQERKSAWQSLWWDNLPLQFNVSWEVMRTGQRWQLLKNSYTVQWAQSPNRDISEWWRTAQRARCTGRWKVWDVTHKGMSTWEWEGKGASAHLFHRGCNTLFSTTLGVIPHSSFFIISSFT